MSEGRCIGCGHMACTIEARECFTGKGCPVLDDSRRVCGCLGACPKCGCKSIAAAALPPSSRVCEVCRCVWEPASDRER